MPVGEDRVQHGDDVSVGSEMLQSEHSLQLLHDHNDRRSSHETSDGRSRQEIHQYPKPEDPQRGFEDAGEEGGGEHQMHVQF